MTAEPIAFDLGAPPSDGALASDYLSGGESAFAELYRRYYSRLVRFCARRTGDSHLAEDIAQETLLRALRYLDGFDTERPMWPWLKTIAGRIAYQASQKSTRERCEDLAEIDPDSAWSENPCGQVDEQIVLLAALGRVPDRQRAALQMRYVDDWSTVESAKFAGMTVPAFEQLLFRARRKLGSEYRRLTEARHVGAIGAFLALAVRSLRRVGRLRADQVTASFGTGAIGAATLSLSIAALVAPASPALRLPDGGVAETARQMRVATGTGKQAAATDARYVPAPVTRPVAVTAPLRVRHEPSGGTAKPTLVTPVPEHPGHDPDGNTRPPGGAVDPDLLPGLPPLLECGESMPACP